MIARLAAPSGTRSNIVTVPSGNAEFGNPGVGRRKYSNCAGPIRQPALRDIGRLRSEDHRVDRVVGSVEQGDQIAVGGELEPEVARIDPVIGRQDHVSLARDEAQGPEPMPARDRRKACPSDRTPRDRRAAGPDCTVR